LKTSKLKNDKAWLTPRIKDGIAKRQKLYKLYNMVDRKKQFNRVRHLILARKTSYYRNLKIWWPVVNQARGKTKNNEVKIPPNLLSKQFHDVWVGDKQPNLREFKESLTKHDISLNVTTQIAIETLGTLNATKAAGPDELNNRVLKEARFHLAEVIPSLFNTSLRESFVPSQSKQSKIIPIPKVQNPTQPNEYRPVCLTSCLGKVMEKIIAKTYCVKRRQYGKKATSSASYRAGTPWMPSSK
jgi:hypothetical protein